MIAWKEFEVLVAALHHASSAGGRVTWNETIDGRQFDVTIRFLHGVHDYLTVVECKDQKDAVAVSEIDAFVTKSRAARANKGVVISTSGFQSGAIAVAERENIVLLTVSAAYEKPDLPADATPIDAINIKNVSIVFRNRPKVSLGDDAKLHYLARHCFVRLPDGSSESLDGLLRPHAEKNMDRTTELKLVIPFPKGSSFVNETGKVFKQASRIEYTAGYISAHGSSTPPLDFQLQQALAKKYVLSRVDGSVVFERFFVELSLGLWTTVEPGNYYADPSLGFFYRCEEIVGELVTWFLVESYQYGGLVQGRFTANSKFNIRYTPVTDKAKLRELERLYQKVIDRERCEGDRREDLSGHE